MGWGHIWLIVFQELDDYMNQLCCQLRRIGPHLVNENLLCMLLIIWPNVLEPVKFHPGINYYQIVIRLHQNCQNVHLPMAHIYAGTISAQSQYPDSFASPISITSVMAGNSSCWFSHTHIIASKAGNASQRVGVFSWESCCWKACGTYHKINIDLQSSEVRLP